MITAIGGSGGAGIGTGHSWDQFQVNLSSVEIKAGTVIAKGGNNGAGIGGGRGYSSGSITISGGTVNAEGGEDAAGIGGGSAGGQGGEIDISGGTITVTGTLGGDKATMTVSGGSLRTDDDPTGPVTNRDGEELWMITLTIPGVDSPAAVSAFYEPDSYEIDDMYTDDQGRLYIWLPGNPKTNIRLMVDGMGYAGTINVTSDHKAQMELDPPLEVEITTDPEDANIIAGEDHTFSVVASGNPEPTYKWQVKKGENAEFADIENSNSNELRLENIGYSSNGWEYRCEVSNYGRSIQSKTAALHVTRKDNNLRVSFPDYKYGETPSPVVTNPGGGSLSYQYKETSEDSNSYTENRPTDAGMYVLKVMSEATEYYNEETIELHFDILKASQEKPPVPEQVSMTASEITVKQIDGAEYQISNGPWQESPVFTGLEPDTTYSISVRYPGDKNHEESQINSKEFSTSKAEMAGTISIIGTLKYNETLSVDKDNLSSDPVIANLGEISYQWFRNGVEINGAIADSYTLTKADIAARISVTVSAENCLGEITSDQTLPIEQADGPELLAEVAGTYVSAGDTFTYTIDRIPGAEYRIDGGEWQDENEFTGIAPLSQHTFNARIKETETYKAGAAGTTVTVNFIRLDGQTAPPLTYTVSAGDFPKTVTITPVTGAEYQFNGNAYSDKNTYLSYYAEDVSLSIRMAGTKTVNPSPATTATVNTNDLAQNAPLPFELTYAEVNGTSYMVSIPVTDGAEYSFDGITWGSDNGRTDCKPGETITGYKRMAARPGYHASPVISASVTLPPFQTRSSSSSDDSYYNDGSYHGKVTLHGINIPYTVNNSTGIVAMELTPDVLNQLVTAADGNTMFAININSPVSIQGMDISFSPAWFTNHQNITIPVSSGSGGIHIGSNLARKFPDQNATAVISVREGGFTLSAQQNGQNITLNPQGQPFFMSMLYRKKNNEFTSIVFLYDRNTGATVSSGFSIGNKVIVPVHTTGEYGIR